MAIPIEKCTAKANASRTFATEIREKVLPNGDRYFEAQICAGNSMTEIPTPTTALAARPLSLPQRMLLFDLDQVAAS
ncbi:hypothetical protein [Ensifer sp. BR816]|uniref:hypothetical protein n=1 Tax=Rhizobium sp. (strain BR816) TaxID=1057002 RepID=UPI000372A352|nr:hypothetical protein [Ensifer sp. BR816]